MELTATVTAGDRPVDVGTVTFYRSDSSTAEARLGSATVAADGVARLTVPSLPEGKSHLVARYGGSDYFGESTSAVTTHEVTPSAPRSYEQIEMPGMHAVSASVADLTGDGLDDVLVSARGTDSYAGDAVMLYPGSASGAQAQPIPVVTHGPSPSTAPVRLATGDVDGDGSADAVHSSDVGVFAHFRDRSNPYWFGTTATVTTDPARDVVVADVATTTSRTSSWLRATAVCRRSRAWVGANSRRGR